MRQPSPEADTLLAEVIDDEPRRQTITYVDHAAWIVPMRMLVAAVCIASLCILQLWVVANLDRDSEFRWVEWWVGPSILFLILSALCSVGMVWELLAARTQTVSIGPDGVLKGSAFVSWASVRAVLIERERYFCRVARLHLLLVDPRLERMQVATLYLPGISVPKGVDLLKAIVSDYDNSIEVFDVAQKSRETSRTWNNILCVYSITHQRDPWQTAALSPH
jgi:hypothetical protein